MLIAYWIEHEDSYSIKEEIADCGASWNQSKKKWTINLLGKDDPAYIVLKSLGCKLIPVNLPPELQNIQDILNKKRR